jgi:hypothetical protein
MPKMLVIAACLINLGDDRGGVDHAVGQFVDVPKDTARILADNERALYVEKTADHTKEGRYTAHERMVKAAEAMAKPAKKAEQTPA